jgi:HEAT repeat protein
MGEIVGVRGFAEEKKEEEEKKVSDNVVNALIKGLEKDEEIRVRLASAQALGDTFSHRAIEPLRAIADDENEDAMLRVVAVRSLTKILSNPGTERVVLSEELVNEAVEEVVGRFGNLINLVPIEE